MDIFRRNWLGDDLMMRVYSEYWQVMEGMRKNEALKLWDWYFNEKSKILGYLQLAMLKTFSPETLAKMHIRVFNIVRRVVRKVALINKLPTLRNLDGGKQEVITGEGQNATTEKKQSEDDKKYQEALLHSTIQRKEKEWRRLGIFFNTVLVQPVWIYDTENPSSPSFEPYMDFIIHTPAYTSVNTEPFNHLRPAEFWYEIKYRVDGIEQDVIVYWSRTEHFMMNVNGARIAVPGSQKNGGSVLDNNMSSNPYGKLPVAVYRIEEGNDFWGDGMWDLVEGNEEVCIQMSNLFYTSIFQSHGERVALNMNETGGTKKTGPDVTHAVDNVRADAMKPEAYFIHPEPVIEPIRGLIDWFMDGLQQIKGVVPQSYQLDQKAMAGIAKIMDAAELAEDRADQMIIDQEFEYDLFEAFRTVWNYWNQGKQISEKAVFSAKVIEPKPPESTDEKIKRREAGLKNNWMSLLDVIIEDNPGITHDEALKKLEQIILEKRKLTDKFGLFDGGNAAGGGNPAPIMGQADRQALMVAP